MTFHVNKTHRHIILNTGVSSVSTQKEFNQNDKLQRVLILQQQLMLFRIRKQERLTTLINKWTNIWRISIFFPHFKSFCQKMLKFRFSDTGTQFSM